jgi:hypothetical protein
MPPDRREEHQPDSSPYGPQHGHVDQAAGGADSSPFEDVPSGEKKEVAQEEERRGSQPTAGQPGASEKH